MLIIGEQRSSVLGISREGLGWKLVCTRFEEEGASFFLGRCPGQFVAEL